MSNNSEIAAIFYEIAEILEMQGVPWKPRAYQQAAQSIEALRKDVSGIYSSGGLKALEAIPNVGKALAKKIEEYIKSKKINEHQKLLSTLPKHTLELMRIPGLGAKRIHKLSSALGINTVKDLKKAAKSHKIAKLEGFGSRLEKDILEAIEISKESADRISLKEAQKQANSVIFGLKKKNVVQKIEVAGSIRRKRAFVKDIDIIATSNNPEKAIAEFTKLKDIKNVLSKGPTKAMVVLQSGTQADLRVLKPESWGAGLYYFTGSKNYDISVRKIAIKKGYKLNEYGLFDKKTGKLVAGKTEREITDKLGIKLPKPEDRDI
ncbi:MAG: helix-hairpin-helix domain-containing protein [archaeon]|jgi:DNA polymerase (family 10)|nr:helix-hairpin-helix domain-containing protein [archaeon]